ncbi:MAG: hypothetical protein PSX37_08675 [bacterium]|nr:hypothetical protein [bacterium]
MSRRPQGHRVLLRGILLAVFAAVIYMMKGRLQGPVTPLPAPPPSSQRPAAQPLPQLPSDSSVSSGPAKADSTANAPKPAAKASPVPSRAESSAQTSLVIASWNIEWLGKPDDRSGPARGRAQSAADLAECLASTGASIVAVEEIIATAGTNPPRSKELDATIVELNGRTKGQWDYELFPGRNADDQLTGVLWNIDDVQAVDAAGAAWDERDSPYRVPVKSGRSAKGNSLWNRPPHAMKFSAGEGRSDIVVIVVHMKADYQGDFASHRAEEATALSESLAAVRKVFVDDDIIVLGDTNCVQQVEPALDIYAKAGLRDLNAKNEQTHWRGGSMDRIMVMNGQPEFAASVFSVASDRYLERKRWKPEDFKRVLSDHYPVYATVAIEADDD